MRVVREDPNNRDLLYAGTARGVYVSLNRGQNWHRFMTGLPTVPVYDLQIHPRDRELIAATHGRGFWIVDVAPLQQLTAAIVAKNVHLFAPKRAFEYNVGPNLGASANGSGQGFFEAPSPQHGAEIVYRLASATRDTVRIVITDARGDTVETLTGQRRAGVHKVVWDFRGPAPRRTLGPAARRDSAMVAQRAKHVIDSLEKTGKIPAQAITALRGFASGQAPTGFGGGGGGGGDDRDFLVARLGPGGEWVERPGESRTTGGGGGGGGGGAALAARINSAFGSAQAFQSAFPGGIQELRSLFCVPGHPGLSGALGGNCGGGGGGGGGFGNQAPLVQTGDYLVTLRVGSEIQRQVLRVEHVGPGEGTSILTSQEDRK